MPDYFHSSHNEISPRLQGSVLWGMLGSIAGMLIGCFMLLLGLALFLMIFLLTDVSALTVVDGGLWFSLIWRLLSLTLP